MRNWTEDAIIDAMQADQDAGLMIAEIFKKYGVSMDVSGSYSISAGSNDIWETWFRKEWEAVCRPLREIEWVETKSCD